MYKKDPPGEESTQKNPSEKKPSTPKSSEPQTTTGRWRRRRRRRRGVRASTALVRRARWRWRRQRPRLEQAAAAVRCQNPNPRPRLFQFPASRCMQPRCRAMHANARGARQASCSKPLGASQTRDRQISLRLHASTGRKGGHRMRFASGQHRILFKRAVRSR